MLASRPEAARVSCSGRAQLGISPLIPSKSLPRWLPCTVRFDDRVSNRTRVAPWCTQRLCPRPRKVRIAKAKRDARNDSQVIAHYLAEVMTLPRRSPVAFCQRTVEPSSADLVFVRPEQPF